MARFTFPHPGEARQVRFTSLWVTPIMRGLGQKIEVDFPIVVPMPERCGA
jgi:hypothetical protein